MDYILILCTINDKSAAVSIAKVLVEKGLIACANIIPNTNSIYKWDGEVQTDEELLMVMKSKDAHFERVKNEIEMLHPYEVPEVISIPLKFGSEAYLNWIDSVLK